MLNRAIDYIRRYDNNVNIPKWRVREFKKMMSQQGFFEVLIKETITV